MHAAACSTAACARLRVAAGWRRAARRELGSERGQAHHSPTRLLAASDHLLRGRAAAIASPGSPPPFEPKLTRHVCIALSRQGINLASANFMTKQTDINEKMRAILIDWLVEVHLKFKLMPETLYLTTNLIDRFLEKETIARNKLQLVGVTAMFVASKYEEIYAPECRDFVYISDKAYTREQILQMEGLMLSKLNFQLTTPNALVFLKRFAKVANILATPRTKTELLANYFVELTLQEYKMLKYLPSTVAAAATYLALKTMGQQNPWVRATPTPTHPARALPPAHALAHPSRSTAFECIPSPCTDLCSCTPLGRRRRSFFSTHATRRRPSCRACATLTRCTRTRRATTCRRCARSTRRRSTAPCRASPQPPSRSAPPSPTAGHLNVRQRCQEIRTLVDRGLLRCARASMRADLAGRERTMGPPPSPALVCLLRLLARSHHGGSAMCVCDCSQSTFGDV